MLNELFGLDGQVAVVTGAGWGVGEGIARTLAGAGATVVCTAQRTHEIEKVAIDIVASNAGGSPIQAPLVELPREEWDATLALNLTAVFEACRVAVPRMADGGRILNISSGAAQDVWAGSGHYSPAKAGVNSLTQALARELGPKIRVNAIIPGLVPTEIVRESLNLTDADLPALEESLNLPAGRLCTPEDLGAAVLYLCSPAAEWVTGQYLRVSGGG